MLRAMTATGPRLRSPDEITSKKFLVSLRGYDREEVAAYLQEIAAEVAAFTNEHERVRADLAAARAGDLPPEPTAATPVPPEPVARSVFEQLGDEVARILGAADAAATEMTERAASDAERQLTAAAADAGEAIEAADIEASGLIDTARSDAARIVDDAAVRRRALLEEIERLEAIRTRLRDDLRRASLQVVALVSDEGDDAGFGEVAAGLNDLSNELHDSVVEAASDPDASDPDASDPGEVPDPEVVDATDTTDTTDTTDVVDGTDAIPEGPPPVPQAGSDSTVSEATAAPDASTTAGGAAAGTGRKSARQTRRKKTTKGGGAEPASSEPPGAGSGAGPPGMDPVRLRADSLATVESGLLRRSRRQLQDLRSSVLERLGDPEGGDPARVMPSDDDFARLGAVGQMFLTSAYRAGLHDGAVLLGQPVPDAAGSTDLVLAGARAFHDDLAREIRTSLTAAFAADSGDDGDAASARVEAAFELLADRVLPDVAADHLVRTYGHGTLDIWDELGATSKAWVPNPEQPCTWQACVDNIDADRTPLNTAFPSGAMVPPAYPGCSCAVAPDGGQTVPSP